LPGSEEDETGAVMLGGEMIDAASRKMAVVMVDGAGLWDEGG
jgi:hypothetical protein